MQLLLPSDPEECGPALRVTADPTVSYGYHGEAGVPHTWWRGCRATVWVRVAGKSSQDTPKTEVGCQVVYLRVTGMVAVTYTVSGCCPGNCLVWSFVLPNRVSRWEGGGQYPHAWPSPPLRCRWRCAEPRGTAAYLAVVLANAEAHTVAALDAGSASRRCHASPLRAPRRLDSGIAQRRPGTGASETWLCI